jgi:hypothetical protein
MKCRFCGEWLEQPFHANPAPPKDADSPVPADSTFASDAPQNREYSTRNGPVTTELSTDNTVRMATCVAASETRYRVEYKGQRREASEIKAHSPEEAAKRFLEQDSERRHEDYGEIRVFWGMFGRNHQSFKTRDLLPHVISLSKAATTATEASIESQSAIDGEAPLQKMSTGRKTFWVLLALIVALDVLTHFFAQLQLVWQATNRPTGLYLLLVLSWNTLAESIEVLTSDVGIVALVILTILFFATAKPRPPQPSAQTKGQE